MEACGLAPGSCKAVAEADEVQAAFEQVVTHGRRPTRSAARIAALQLHVLLLKIGDDSLPLRRQRQAYRTFARCRAYLDEQFLAVSSVEQAASACHVAPAYLSRLFARYSREAPYRYLLRKRMTKAADWLDDGRLLAREVADRLGMDPFHFSRVFKRIHGLSPAAFMQRRESLWGP
jgi:AraC-like DNA-binding protein